MSALADEEAPGADGRSDGGSGSGSTTGGGSGGDTGEPLTPWELTRKRYESIYIIEKEDKKVGDKNGGKEDQETLMKMKGFLRNRKVAASWNPAHRVDHPLSAIYWQRVSTVQDGRPPMPLASQHVTKLDLEECLTGDLEKLGPLLSMLGSLRELRLNGNKSLTGDLALIDGKQLPNLQSINLMGTSIHTERGLLMFASCAKMKSISIMGLARVKGTIPDGMLKLPGLHLQLEGSGMVRQDSVGNRKRAALRFARSALPKAPKKPPPERVANPNAKQYPLPSQVELHATYALPPWRHGNRRVSRAAQNQGRVKGPPLVSPEYRSPAIPYVHPK